MFTKGDKVKFTLWDNTLIEAEVTGTHIDGTLYVKWWDKSRYKWSRSEVSPSLVERIGQCTQD